VIVNEGPPWYIEEKQLSDEVRGRLRRWKARWAARNAGGAVLSLAELGQRIKQTQQAIDSTSSAADRAILSVQLEDMRHEHAWRSFLDEEETIWPA
jgi:hypothetical protein